MGKEIIIKRSIQEMMASELVESSKQTLVLLDLTDPENGLKLALETPQIQVRRIESGEVGEPIDFIICDEMLLSKVGLQEVIHSFVAGFYLILMDIPVGVIAEREINAFNPHQYGAVQSIPIAKRTDVQLGMPTMIQLLERPVIRITLNKV